MSTLMADVLRTSDFNVASTLMTFLVCYLSYVLTNKTLAKYPSYKVAFSCVILSTVTGGLIGALGRVYHVW